MNRASLCLLLSGALLAFTANAQPISSQNISYSSLDKITSANHFFFFVLNDDQHGLELWRSNGSSGGTHIIKDINPGDASSSPDHFLLMDSILFFTANDGIHGEELWRSDGTFEGTFLVRDIFFESVGSTIKDLTEINRIIIIEAEHEIYGAVRWRSDGTALGTMPLSNSITDYMAPDLNSMLSINNIIYGRESNFLLTPVRGNKCRVDGITLFVVNDESVGSELWRSNGTHSGTTLVKDIHHGKKNSQITAIANVNGKVYFSGNDGKTGSELWKSDGTSKGTALVKDIMPGPDSSLPRNFTAFGNMVVFSVFGTDGIELWVTNGSADGTAKVFPSVMTTSTALLTESEEIRLRSDRTRIEKY